MNEEKKPDIVRHARHIMLKEIGGVGQKRIANATVAIIGMGGLGCPAALYLAAAGVRKLILIDYDVVDVSNLQRQIIYKTDHIGQSKVKIAQQALQELDPNIEIIVHQTRINGENAYSLLKDADLILDGCDNFETRFIVNKSAFELRKILVSGALGRFNGQVMAFDYRGGNGPCYQCLVPQMPPNPETCEIMGVVGAICGIIGSIMALEAIKIIVNNNETLINRILVYDGLDAKMRNIALNQDKDCKICAN